MRAIAAVLFLTVSACASSGAKTDSEISRPTERIVASDRQGVIRSSNPSNPRVAIAAPPSQVLTVMKQVFDDLGIASAIVDAASGRISAPTFTKTRKFGNENLSMYFNCGDSLNGNIANTYRIYISVAAAVRPDGKGGTELETVVSGSAADMGGSSSGRIPCGTTGRLEEIIHNAVRQKVGAAN
jgi:hypothetical protein